MTTDRCLQCGRRGATLAVLGGWVHPRCVPPPAGRNRLVAMPPPDRDLRLQRAVRLTVPRPPRKALR